MSEEVSYYKVSYVVQDGGHTGAIINEDKRPQVGQEVSFDGRVFEVLEVLELMPSVGAIGFLHATCRYLRDADED